MTNKIIKIGKALLILGILLLILSIIFAFTLGTIIVPICFVASIIINTVAVMMIRHKG